MISNQFHIVTQILSFLSKKVRHTLHALHTPVAPPLPHVQNLYKISAYCIQNRAVESESRSRKNFLSLELESES